MIALIGLAAALDNQHFFDNQPDGTIAINTYMMNKSSNWQNDDTAGYGQWTSVVGAWMETTFVGSTFHIAGTRSSSGGSFDLYIDGTFNGTVRCTGLNTRFDHTILASIDLKPGYHLIRIVTTIASITIDGIFFKPDGLQMIPSSSLNYVGSWTDDVVTWGGSTIIGKYTETSGDYVEATINGEYFMVSGTIKNIYKTAEVYIDGSLVSSRNCWYFKTNFKAMIFAYTLSKGTHTVKYRSNNGLIGFSGFYVAKELVTALNPTNFYLNHPDDMILLSMDVVNKSNSWIKNGIVDYGQLATAPNQWIETSFVGSSFNIIGMMTHGLRTFSLYIDGKMNRSVDAFSGMRTNHTQLVSVNLIPGYHTIRMTFSGSGYVIDGICFKPEGLTRVSFNSLRFTGNWRTDAGVWGGDTSLGNYTLNSGDSIEYTFQGAYLLICGTIANNYESANLIIDNKLVKTINCRSSRRDLKATLFTYELPPGEHTVAFRTSGKVGFSGLYIGKFFTYHSYTEFTNKGTWAANPGEGHQWTSGTASTQSMDISLRCTTVAIKGIYDTNHGYIDVKVDNILVSTINEYRSSRIMNEILFSFTVPLATHTISLVRSTANAKAIDIYGIYALDNLEAGSFNLNVKKINAGMGSVVVITVSRLGGSNGPSGVDISFIDGTAHNNDIYKATNQTLVFNGGDNTKTINIQTNIKSYPTDRSLTFIAKLSNPQHFGILGDLNETEVTIVYIANPTSSFTRSDEFTKSNTYLKTNKFTNSIQFTKSSMFTKSIMFIKSNIFSKSSAFTKSNIFSSFYLNKRSK